MFSYILQDNMIVYPILVNSKLHEDLYSAPHKHIIYLFIEFLPIHHDTLMGFGHDAMGHNVPASYILYVTCLFSVSLPQKATMIN